MQLSMPSPNLAGRFRARGDRHAAEYAVRTDEPTQPPADALERFVREYLAGQGPVARPALVSAVAAWLGRQERSLAGGVGDLGAWGDGLWGEEAARRIARLEGSLVGGSA